MRSLVMDRPRFVRLYLCAVHAATNPFDLFRYLRYLRATPLDVGLPWFAYGAIHFLESYLQPRMTVFEYGSGGSTIFFAPRVSRVVSRETDPRWIEMTKRAMPHAANTTFVLNDHVNSPFDVIVVDHSEALYNPAASEDRAETFLRAERFVKPGGIIVLDDSWRHRDLRKDRTVRVFEGLGPCRVGVTSTDVYLY